MPAILQSHILPAFTSVNGFVNAVAYRGWILLARSFTRTCPQEVRIFCGDIHIANCNTFSCFIKNRSPVDACVDRFEYAACGRADIYDRVIVRMNEYLGYPAPKAAGTDSSPVKVFEHIFT